MMDANEYLLTVKMAIVASSSVVDWEIVREEIQGNDGLYRYRLFLLDGSLLAAFERFEATESGFIVHKYSFHWQDAAGELRQRWDNAAHHPELAIFPHHTHIMRAPGGIRVESSPRPSIEQILQTVTADLSSDT